MTEIGQVHSENVSQNQNVQQPAPAPVSAPSTPATQTRVYTEDEVNGIIGAKKQKAYDKGYETAKSELTQQPVQPTQQPSLTPESVKEMAKAEAKAEYEQQQNQARANQFVQQFSAKMEAGKEKYDDFEPTVASLQLHTIPDIVQLANVFDNTKEIMYDLGKNKSKVASFLVLAKTAPHLAYQEMQALSESIKKNESSLANQKNVSPPLSQIKPSTVGTDNGERTITDLRQEDYLRG